MSTTTKTFQFATDAEGWVATPGDGFVNAVWYPPHYGKGSANKFTVKRPNPPLTTYGGSLRTTGRIGAMSSENYWEWTGTWEDLGVPAGEPVTAVQGDYLYRFVAVSGANRASMIEFTSSEAGSGPFELRDSGGTLIDTFSTRGFAPARTAGDHWKSYPVGNATDPIAVKPSAWIDKVGSNISVPLAQQASNTTIKLRLGSLTPDTTRFGPPSWLRLKQDYIVLTITYTSGAIEYVNVNSIIFSID